MDLQVLRTGRTVFGMPDDVEQAADAAASVSLVYAVDHLWIHLLAKLLKLVDGA